MGSVQLLLSLKSRDKPSSLSLDNPIIIIIIAIIIIIPSFLTGGPAKHSSELV